LRSVAIPDLYTDEQKLKFIQITSISSGSLIVNGTVSLLNQISLDQTKTNM
jgi:hypothetical protein